jgi:His/Glu/Gln/Arg/opine family amino acid ABC transporter permease subunit
MIIDGFTLQLIDGARVTLCVAVVSVVIGVITGLIGAVLELSNIRVVRNLFSVIFAVIRGLPELLVIFAIYFGSVVIKETLNLHGEISSFTSGVVALGSIYGAYATQVFRGAILMINVGQVEAAKSLGFSKLASFRLIVFPQVLHYSLPGLSNLCLVTLKDSALVALIGLQDLTFKAQVAANQSYKPFTYYMLCALIYLVLTSMFEVLFKLISRKRYGF